MDWHHVIFDPDADWLGRFESIATKRFGAGATAEEAATFVLEKMSADGWALLSDYSGRSTVSTYVHSVAANLIEDFARSRFGRVRPPTWVEKLGDVWVVVFKLLCLKRLAPEEIVSSLASRHPDEAMLREAIRSIRARVPRCGEAGTGQVVGLDEDPDRPPDPHLMNHSDPAKEIDEQTINEILHILAVKLDIPSDSPSTTSPHLTDVARRIVAVARTLPLDDRDRIILRLIHQEDMKIAAVARTLNEEEHTIRRHYSRLLDRMRKVFSDNSIDLNALQDVLRDPDLERHT